MCVRDMYMCEERGMCVCEERGMYVCEEMYMCTFSMFRC